MQIIINHIDKIRKHIKNDSDKNNKMMIAIDYDDANDNWEYYKIYYNKCVEISSPFDFKILNTLEEVGEEIELIREYYGEIDYLAYFDENNNYKVINIK